MSVSASTIDDLRGQLLDAARDGRRVLAVGGRSKPALSTPARDDVVALEVDALRGIVEYDPRELTVTALAGTPVAEIRDALAEHGQHLPFDPPLAAAGATLGGVVACGAAGAGGFRHGGVRDFVIGVRFLDGAGTLVGGGGRVVKNAAGFDLPKLLVGSLGRLGVIVQLSFKVFPRPVERTTAVLTCESLADALAATARIGRGPLGVEALDLDPPGRLLVRLNGPRATLAERLATVVGGARVELLDADADRALWDDARELRWIPPEHDAIRLALTPGTAAALATALAAPLRFTLGANAAWVAWPRERPLAALDDTLRELGLAGMRLTGPAGPPLIGAVPAHAFAQRIRAALDPDSRFPED
ncbi:FAD-binding protein [Conexibacter sp. CPCC 206217]|uniref:FAD-binding protein n=1 Tax=Conexibacter sp. CPCC 206217 TaxID=3064574 RepID=UPI0027178C38|nr:FAD-binding protein [Conexibacter sp. CPCC 206217]MDO8211076.1 FAD-binding protein [Conexibacter sp. CPCC 206217]